MLTGYDESLLRKEDARLLTGRGRFTGDINLPRQVYGQILRAPHAHADIHAIDITAAKQAPGVLAVLTGADAVAEGLGREVARRRRGCAGPDRGALPRRDGEG